MRLQKLRLHSFAGSTDRTYEFVPGMNVVLGPNEAGKSTMINGLLCALFESTRYGKVRWRESLERFVPRGGGDTFGVSLDFLVGDQTYQIKKLWGGECRSELTLPSGQVVRNTDDVERQVADLLRLKRGTWHNILVASQSAISSTLRDFKPDSEEASDLAQILRRSAFDTDGVSIEKLERAISDQLSQVSSRWDLEADQPENRRGIENPWKQGVGTLLRAWYEYEHLKNELRTVENHERKLDQTNQRVSELIAERDELQIYVNTNEPIVNALKERQALELQLNAAKANDTRLGVILTTWPLHASEISRLESSLKVLDAEHDLLRNELEQAQSYQKSAAKREKMAAAKVAAKKLGDDEEAFAAFKDLSPQLFQDLKAAIADRDRYAASMAAGKLQVRFIPNSDTTVNIKAGLEDSRDELATTDQPLHTAADGVITLTTDQFRLEVESGDGQFSAIQGEHESALARIRDLLSTIGATSVDEANRREIGYSNAKTNLERAQSTLETILSGQTLAELESASGDNVPAPKREIAEINNTILDSRAKHHEQQTEISKKRADITTWEVEFETQDAVLDHLVEARARKMECETQLKRLPPLPEGIESVETLESEFNRKRHRLTKIKEEELPEAKNQQSTLNATLPSQTTQELRDVIAEAESRLSLEKQRLHALTRVNEVFQQMKTRMDSGTFDPWTRRLSQTIQQVTSARYRDLDFGAGVTRCSGIVIPRELLSMGTKASMGFCIRISMAAHFLDGLDGFVVLDDPMVDLDADRQRQTAEVLREFAEQKQVILLTCHEAHAALLTQSPLLIKRDGEG